MLFNISTIKTLKDLYVCYIFVHMNEIYLKRMNCS